MGEAISASNVSARDYCHVTKAASASISNDTDTLVALDTYVTNNTYMNNTANKVKIEKPWVYLITANCRWDWSSITDAHASLNVYKNWGAINWGYYADDRMNVIMWWSGIDLYCNVSVTTILAKDDLISINVYQKNSWSGTRSLLAASLQVTQL